MSELSCVTSNKQRERRWPIEMRLDLETGKSVAAVGQKALQWSEKSNEPVLEQQFEQLKGISSEERGPYLEFLASLKELPKGLQVISDRLAELERAALTKKSGHMWECVGYRDGIDEFRMKGKYDSNVTESWDSAFDELKKEIAPATELSADEIAALFDTSAADKITLKQDQLRPLGASKDLTLRDAYQRFGLALFRVAPQGETRWALMSLIYEELGFGVRVDEQGTVMWLPGTRELERRWADLQQKNPKLADLSILEAEGIASDFAFIEGNVTHDVIVSRDKEYVHDYTMHLVPQIELLTTLAGIGYDYRNYKHSVVKSLFGLYKRVLSVRHKLKGLDPSFPISGTEVDMLARSLGAVVDVSTALEVPVDPLGFLERARMLLQKKTDEYYRAATESFPGENLRKMPLLWTRLRMATSPLYGYPDLDREEVKELLAADPNLLGVCTKETLWIKRGQGKYLEKLSYELEGGQRLIAKNGQYRFEKEVGSWGMVSAQDFRQIAKLIDEDEAKLDKLRGDLPKSLRIGAEPASKLPISAEDTEVGDFVIWKWKNVYGHGFALSLVLDLEGRHFFWDYPVHPVLHHNQTGFLISMRGSREKKDQFVPADSYKDFLAWLKTGKIGEQKLGQEIKVNYTDS